MHEHNERDNYNRISGLLHDNATPICGKLMDQYLIRMNKTFIEFIDDHQHDIFHFYSNKKCCICIDNPSSKSILRKKQIMIVFETDDKAQRKNGHKHNRNKQMCCCFANRNIRIHDLDFTLLKFILINFCRDEFWRCFLVSYQHSFENFLNRQKHNLFHIWRPGCACCICRTGYIPPHANFISKEQFRKLFIKIPPVCCTPSHQIHSCTFKAEPGLTHENVEQRDLALLDSLTNYFCPLRACIESLGDHRNDVVAHTVSAQISYDDFNHLWEGMENCILAIAEAVGFKTEAERQIHHQKTGPLDMKMCKQWHTELLIEIQQKEELLHEIMDTKEAMEFGLEVLDAKMDICIENDKRFQKCIEEKHEKLLRYIGEENEKRELDTKQSLNNTQFCITCLNDFEGITNSNESNIYRKQGVTSHNHIIEDNNNKDKICQRNESILDSECSTDKAKQEVPEIPKNINLDFTVSQMELEITYSKGQIREVHDCSFNHTETFDITKYFEVISFYKELKGFLLYLSVLSWYTRCLFEQEVLNDSDSNAVHQSPERRRKIHVEPEASLEHFVYGVDDEDIDDSHECGRCKETFKSLDSFMNHKIYCRVKRTDKKITRADFDPEDLTTQFRHTFSTDNEQFMNDILKMIKENADKLTSRNISNDFYEKGSLVLWGKMDRSVTKDRDLVKKCMEEFVAKMFETCPPNSEKETKCTIKLDIVKEIEGCEDDDEDVFCCGRCNKLFNRIDVFSSHKKECNRRARILRTLRETVLREEENSQTVQAQCIIYKQDRVIKTDLDDNQKRWLLVGICIQSILSPILRKFTEPVVLSLFNSMKLSINIETQTYPNHLKRYPNSKSQLNYEAINKNQHITQIGKKPDVAKYDYRVRNHIEFSKLFLRTRMAQYTSFEETCDVSALLSLIINICTFRQSVKNVALKILSDVQNPWAHCNLDEWDTLTYQRSFQLMHQLIKCLNLNEQDTTLVIEDLTKWETNGFMFLQGYAVDQHVVTELTQQTQVLTEHAVKMRSDLDSTYMKVHEALLRINGKMNFVCQRVDDIERKQIEQIKSLNEMNKAVTIFSKRPSENTQPKHGQCLGTIPKLPDVTHGADKLIKDTPVMNIVGQLADDVIETTEDILNIKSDITAMKMDIGDFQIYMSKTKPMGKIFFYPPNRSEYFVAREKEMNQINHSFVEKGNSSHTLVICGVPGCGKTTLAAEFAWRSQEFYDGGVFWMSAESENSLLDSITTLSIDVSTSGKDFRETFKRTLTWFSNLNQRWLLVVDNADEEHLADYTKELLVGQWRVNTNGHIIITTRLDAQKILESMMVKLEDCIRLPLFDTTEALEFVKMRASKGDNREDRTVISLVDKLGGLPLALEQAVAHIKSVKCSFANYVKKFEKKRMELLKTALPMEKISKEQLAVATTWQLNIESISEIEILGSAAITVMETASYLFADDIPTDMFNIGHTVVADCNLKEELNDDIGCRQVIEILTRFSLFKIVKDKSISIHRLVQELIRDNMNNNRRHCILQHALRMVKKAIDSSVSPNHVLQLDNNKVTIHGSLFKWRRLAVNANTLKLHLLHFVKYNKMRQNICLNDQMLKILQTTALYHSINQRQALALADQEQMFKLIPKLKFDTKYFHEPTCVTIPLLQKDREMILECLASVIHENSKEIIDLSSSVVTYNSETFREIGNKAFKEHRYHDAIQYYTEGIRSCITDNIDSRLYSNRSLSYIKIKDYEHALIDASRCIEIAPDNWKGYCWRAYSVSGLVETGLLSSNLEAIGLASACIAVYKNKLCLGKYEMKICYPIINYKIIEQPESLCYEIMSLADRPFTTLMLRRGLYQIKEILTTTKSILVIGVEEGVEIDTGESFNICRIPKDVLTVDIEPEKTIHAHFENIKFLKGGCQITVSNNSVASFYKCKFSNGQKGCKYFPKCKGDEGCINQSSCKINYQLSLSHTFANKSVGETGFAGICVSDGGIAYVESCVLDRCGGGGILSCGNGSLTEIRNCIIRNMRQMGIEARDGGAIRAIKNTISNNQTHGFAIGPNGYGYISGNIIQGNGAEGVWSGGHYTQDESMKMNEGGASRAVLCNNIIRQNGLSGISLDGGYFEVKGNKIISNWLWGMMVKSRSYSYILDNDIAENKCGGIRIGINYTAAVLINGNTIRDHIGPGIYTVSAIEDSLKTSLKIQPILVGDGEMNGESRNPFIFSTNVLNHNERGILHPQDIFCMTETCCFCRKISQQLKFCSRCKKAKYCSKECQTNHWVQHKHMCKLLNVSYVVEVQMSDTEPNNLGKPTEHEKPYGAYKKTYNPKLVGIGKGTPPDKSSSTPFIVKIQSGRDYGYYDPYKKLIVYDRTVTFDIQLSNPELYHLCNECGVLTGHKLTAKKIFCLASFKNNGQTICFYTDNLPPFQTW